MKLVFSARVFSTEPFSWHIDPLDESDTQLPLFKAEHFFANALFAHSKSRHNTNRQLNLRRSLL